MVCKHHSFPLLHVDGAQFPLAAHHVEGTEGKGKEDKMNRPIISDTKEFAEMCKPIIEYLEKCGNPYTEVHISVHEIKVTSVECGIPLKKAINP